MIGGHLPVSEHCDRFLESVWAEANASANATRALMGDDYDPMTIAQRAKETFRAMLIDRYGLQACSCSPINQIREIPDPTWDFNVLDTNFYMDIDLCRCKLQQAVGALMIEEINAKRSAYSPSP